MQRIAAAHSDAPVVEETGQLQDVTELLNAGQFGLTVQVQSDVVPEPGTMLLLAAGLVGIAARGRRRS